jgi:GNAT superfamily N-acetyltransferase
MPEPRTYAWFFEDWLQDGRRSAKVVLARAGIAADLCWRSGNGQIWLEIQKLKVRKEGRRRGVATRYFHVLAQAVGSLGLVVRATVPEDNAVFAAWAQSLVASGLAVRLDEPGTAVESTWLRRPLRILCR